jgi:beta-glucanase (GH16 family)
MKRNSFFFLRGLINTLLCFVIFSSVLAADAPKPTLPGGNDKWQLKWNDEFDYPDVLLDNGWFSQNGPNTHILCSRWRENAVVSNGTLKLQNRKEVRGGQNWTSGSIWTKQQFQYGYYECRYKYAAATGTNNSFWLMSQSVPTVGKKFEIDINEGHYPSEMNTNIHNWTDITTNPVTGAQSHPSSSKSFVFSQNPDVTIQLEIPVTTRKIRLTSNYASHFHIQEFRIYNVNTAGYPSAMSATADSDKAGLVNFARDAQTKTTASGVYGAGWEIPKAADGTLTTHWVSQTAGAKWLEFEFAADKTVGCIQFVSGWLSGTTYMSVLDDYKVQYFNGTEWIDIQNVVPTGAGVDFGRDFHYFGLEWTADSLKFYANGKLMRAEKNTFCYSPAPVYLSEAIISWAGAVTDAIHGTQMEVDYVRIYDPKVPSDTPFEYIKNGGFEVTTAGSINWEMTREVLNYTAYSWLKTDPADKLVSLRVKSEASVNPFAAILGQKVALDEGQYLFRFKARANDVTPEANKFVFKFSNMYSDNSMFMTDSTPRVVIPTTNWNSYSYKLNLKQDYSGKITFGFGNLGTFDLDSISLIRIGDAVVSDVQPVIQNTATVFVSGNKLVVHSETSQHVEVYNMDGSMLVSTKVEAGERFISLQRKGVFIVSLSNKNGITTKKVIVP